MASLISKVGITGARLGGKTAAKQLGKAVAKKAAKTAAKKILKGAGKKALKKAGKKAMKKVGKNFLKKGGKKALKSAGKKAMKGVGKKAMKGVGKKAMKGAGKKSLKKTLKKASKKGFKKMLKSAGKSDEEGLSVKATPTILDPGDSRADSKRKEHKRKSGKENRKDARVKNKSKETESSFQSRDDSPSPDYSTGEQQSRKDKNATSKEPRVSGTAERKSSSVDAKMKPKRKMAGLFGRRKTSTSDDEFSATTNPPVSDSAVSDEEEHRHSTKSQIHASGSTSRTSSTSQLAESVPTESDRSIHRTSAASQDRYGNRSLGPRQSRAGDEISTKLPSVANRKSVTIPGRPSFRPGGYRTSDAQKTLEKIKSATDFDKMQKKSYIDALAKEAAKEVDDSEFNLMLFRLAKHLMLEGVSNNRNSVEKEKSKRKRKRKSSEWLQALDMILKAQNGCHSNHSQCGHIVAHPTFDSYLTCPCMLKQSGTGVSEKQKENADGKQLLQIKDTEENENKTDHVREENKQSSPMTDPGKDETASSSSSTYGSHSSSTARSSTCSALKFRENAERFCDVVRTLRRNQNHSERSGFRRCKTPCNCVKKLSNYVLPRNRSTVPPPISPGCATYKNTCHPHECCCHHQQDAQPPNLFFPRIDYKPSLPVPVCIPSCDNTFTPIPVQPTNPEAFMITNVVDPSILYLPDNYYF